MLDVNVLGITRTTRATMAMLRAAVNIAAQAAIVNTCSVAATAGLPQRVLYSASKGAVYSLTLAMAADHVAEHIRVNCVNPGTADTPWVGRLLAAASDPRRTCRTQRTSAKRPAGNRPRSRRRDRIPGQPAGGRDHRHRPRRRRRRRRSLRIRPPPGAPDA